MREENKHVLETHVVRVNKHIIECVKILEMRNAKVSPHLNTCWKL